MIRLIFLALVACCVTAQFAQIRLRSISTYKNCIDAKLGTSVISPYDEVTNTNTNTSDTPGSSTNVGVCSVLGEEEEITVIQFVLQQESVAGVDNLVFAINSIPPAGTTIDGSAIPADSQSLSCQGVPTGSACRLLKQPMTVTFDSSIATVQYQMVKRPTYYFYAYIVLYNTNYNTEGQCNSTLCSNGIPFASSLVTCSNVQKPGWVQLTNVIGLSSNCDKPICPESSSSRPYYFGPDSGKPSSAGGNCPIIYCKIPKVILDTPSDSWTAITVGVQGPQCSLWDINPAGVRVMTARATVKRFDYSASNTGNTIPVLTEYIQLSSRQGGAYQQSSSSPLIAQMLPLESSQGSIPPAETGAIMTCSRDPKTLNVVTDMPPLDTTSPSPAPKTFLYNPWTYSKKGTGKALTGDAVAAGCIVPAAACRAYFPEGSTPDSMWYKVEARDLSQYSGTECNSQGMTPVSFANTITASKMCAAAARSSQQCTKAVSGQCVPNYLQFNEIANPLTYTPCLVAQEFEKVLLTTVNTPFNQRYNWPGVPFVPSTYNPLSPVWWVDGGILMSSSVGQNTLQSIITLYTSAKFIKEVTSVSSGKFVNQSMLCNAVQGGPAAVAALVHNTGNLPGLYFATISINVGPRGNVSGIAFEDPTTEVTDGTKVYTVVGTSIGVAAGEYGPVQFNFAYTGPAVNDLIATLSLWILAADNSNGINGYQKVDSVTTACTITAGRVLASRDLNLGDIIFPQDGYTCEWWDVRYWVCWGHYRKLWMYPVNLILYMPVAILFVLILIVIPIALFKLITLRRKSEKAMQRQAEATAKALATELSDVQPVAE